MSDNVNDVFIPVNTSFLLQNPVCLRWRAEGIVQSGRRNRLAAGVTRLGFGVSPPDNLLVSIRAQSPFCTDRKHRQECLCHLGGGAPLSAA